MSSLAILWTLARRDVGRNRRRTSLTLFAVAMGLALLIAINSLISGVFDDVLQNTIKFDTHHVQLRAPSYDPDKLSLLASDLLSAPNELAASASADRAVAAAAPVLWMAGVLSSKTESSNVRLIGLDPGSGISAQYHDAMLTGEYLAADDRAGILVGRRLADTLGVAAGDSVSLAVVDGDGQAVEGTFTVRGTFATGIPAYDDGSALIPLTRAQGMAGVGDRASAVVLNLHDKDAASTVAAALAGPGIDALTWDELNAYILQTVETSMSFYVIMDLIVMAVVAVVITNTLLMSVFERVREMGILAALGLKRRQILTMMMLEAGILGSLGIVLGLALGFIVVAYLAAVGIPIGEQMASVSGNLAMSTTMYARVAPGLTVGLAFWTLVIILAASLYPARFASRLEPVEALKGA